jgi:hypothetical protein
MGWQQTAETEGVALFICEGGAFVEPRIEQQIESMQSGPKEFLGLLRRWGLRAHL